MNNKFCFNQHINIQETVAVRALVNFLLRDAKTQSNESRKMLAQGPLGTDVMQGITGYHTCLHYSSAKEWALQQHEERTWGVFSFNNELYASGTDKVAQTGRTALTESVVPSRLARQLLTPRRFD
eukprot:3079562-Amphidinium_carterae.1